MPTQHLTSAGKEALRKTIRGLREALLSQLKEAAEREYRLGVPLDKARLPEDKAKKRQRLEAWLDEQSRADWPLAPGAKAAMSGKGGASKDGKATRDGKASKGKAAKKANGTAGEGAVGNGSANAEVHVAPQRKKPNDKQLATLRERYLTQAVKEAAHTLINRLVIVRILEQAGLSKPAVLSGGLKSAGYREFTEYATALCSDAEDGTKGYAALLELLFGELALELPGVFGNVGLTRLFPVPAPTLHQVIDGLNEPALDSAWGDDTTLGWVYQFWNDPEREALDDKINGGGKIEPHEIAPKTQMFTERYMVEWLLQNSLGQTWLAMCKKHGWTPDFEQVREPLESRRAAWRKQREAGPEAGGVEPDALMPLHSELEEQWKYWVPQPLPDDAPDSAPESLRELKLLDPACGSGHFLVIAFSQLAALYQEEARHRGEVWAHEQIARFIVEDNLHGIDIDARAIQIAAAAVWLKAKTFAPDVKLRRMNLVAPTFRLGCLSTDDPALVGLQQRLEAEVGLPKSLTRQLVQALDGVDHLGSLLRVDSSVRKALEEYEKDNFGLSAPHAQQELFAGEKRKRIQLSLGDAMDRVMNQLGRFLDAHQGDGDLGLRLEGQQLAAGVRFLQVAREAAYDVVVGNPPYQGTSKMAEAEWFKKHYPRSKADLYACFLERGLEFAKPGGASALLTMRGWMFLSSYQTIREHLLAENDLRSLGDIGTGAFTDRNMDSVIASAMSIWRKANSTENAVVAVQAGDPQEQRFDTKKTLRRAAALLAQVGRYEFDVGKLAGIEGTPLVYWWDETFLDEYIKAPKLGQMAGVRQGLATGDNTRFLRSPWEPSSRIAADACRWVPYIKGAAGQSWCEPQADLVNWHAGGAEIHHFERDGRQASRPQNSDYYFKRGIAFSMIGANFSARAHRHCSIFGHKGSSAFPPLGLLSDILCVLNSRRCKAVLQSLNPGIGTEVGDVLRAPLWGVLAASSVKQTIDLEFGRHESHREPSVEFKRPGPSPWRYAQDWAQRAVDRAKGEPLPPYEPEFDAPEPASFVSFAIGVALGRFGENGEGILDLALSSTPLSSTTQPSANGRSTQAGRRQPTAPPAGSKTKSASNGKRTSNAASPATASAAAHRELSPIDNSHTDNTQPDGLPEVPNIEPSPLPTGQVILPDGILFVANVPNLADSLSHPACERIAAAWAEHGAAIGEGKQGSLEEWLRKDFFAHHKSLYENRPIYLPLSSENKNFVAWVSIHRWANNTLQSLLAGHLLPAQKQLHGELTDLNAARASSDKKQSANAEKQYAKSQKLLEELKQFIRDVTQCAEKGAPPTDAPGAKNACPEREVDAPFMMDLDDGVMINSAALWPLLLPQWKDPKKWWKELCSAEGRKDYDWAHLAARYFPERVDAKCKQDPSLGVAHGCFWKYHPAKAYAWELRLQDEIAPPAGNPLPADAKFTINEVGSDEARARFLSEHPVEAKEIEAKEQQRRERKKKGQSDDDGAQSDAGEHDAELELQSDGVEAAG